ncbi:IclR family transcriptional regulator [Entomomonas sp. E2T0]|uniref:IclR family transcriptional regulator n=1 Tax=Entomomonas sp. E2T0 TaxID=2930213 RepID=UPI0022284B57|nr:IclR family transcriptional regulator [Entomomonas sp. E2T0]UYZ83928.1 IclR family transcriptional regulator [Entomomonas sp. E2T0]
MSTKIINRALSLLELLASQPVGLALTEIAERLEMPKSATHRLLADLMEHSYVQLNDDTKYYQLTLKLTQLGFQRLAVDNIFQVVQPLLNELATISGELVRLSLIDTNKLIFVAKAQGATDALRIDSDMGNEARLAFSASGLAWLSTLDDATAIELIQLQQQRYLQKGEKPTPFNIELLYQQLAIVREQQHARFQNSMGLGTAAMAAPVFETNTHRALGVISIAGPSVRLTEKHMDQLFTPLLKTTQMLSSLSLGISYPSKYYSSINS